MEKRLTDAVLAVLEQRASVAGDTDTLVLVAEVRALRSAPTPEEVTRDYEAVRTCEPGHDAALARLRAGAERAQALEEKAAHLEEFRQHLELWQQEDKKGQFGWRGHVFSAIDTERELVKSIRHGLPTYAWNEGPHEVVSHLLQKVEAAESERDSAREQATALEQSERDLSGHVANLEKVLAAERESLRLCREGAEIFRTERDAARREVAQARERVRALEKQVEAGDERTSGLRARVATLERESIDRANADAKELQRRFELIRELEQEKATLLAKETVREAREAKVRAEAAERRVQELEAQIRAADTSAASAANRAESARSQLAEAEREVARLRTEREETGESFKRLADAMWGKALVGGPRSALERKAVSLFTSATPPAPAPLVETVEPFVAWARAVMVGLEGDRIHPGLTVQVRGFPHYGTARVETASTGEAGVHLSSPLGGRSDWSPDDLEPAPTPDDQEVKDARVVMRDGGVTLTVGHFRALAAAKGGEDVATLQHLSRATAALGRVGLPDLSAADFDAAADALAEKARKWEAAVERANDGDALWSVYADATGNHGAALVPGLTAVGSYVLGLDEPPSGPGGGECEDGTLASRPLCGEVTPCTNNQGHEGGHSWETTAPLTPESLAAVVEAVTNEANTPGTALHALGSSVVTGARELLRRVTGGQVPDVVLKSRVVEVLRGEWAAAMLGFDAGSDGRKLAQGVCEGIAARLGLTLPDATMATKPAETGTYSKRAASQKEPTCQTTLERCDNPAPRACGRCDFHCGHARGICATPKPDMATATHHGGDEGQPREAQSTPTPEGTAVAPVPGFAMPPAAVQSVIQAQPAEPEVVWQGEGVRVLADGTCLVLLWGEWRPTSDKARAAIARALADAKRPENRAGPAVVSEDDVHALVMDGQKLRDAARPFAEELRARLQMLDRLGIQGPRRGTRLVGMPPMPEVVCRTLLDAVAGVPRPLGTVGKYNSKETTLQDEVEESSPALAACRPAGVAYERTRQALTGAYLVLDEVEGEDRARWKQVLEGLEAALTEDQGRSADALDAVEAARRRGALRRMARHAQVVPASTETEGESHG